MNLIAYKRGQGAIVLRVKILNSSVTTGAGLTGLAYGSSGLIISTIADNEAAPTTYTAAGSTIETIATLGTYAAPTATKCRFKEVDATNHKGVYEIQIADARFAVTGAKSLMVSLSGASNAAETDVVIPLVDLDPYDGVDRAKTYYVRKTGNDTTGNGSSAAPWLTINKAVTSCASGDTINVGPGTYAETNSSNYWALPTGFTRFVTIQSETGKAADVIITGATAVSYNIVLLGVEPTPVSWIKFRNVTLASFAASQDVIRMTVANNIYFDHCHFLVDGTTGGHYAVNGIASGTSATGTHHITYDRCTVRQTGTYACAGFYHLGTATFPVDRIGVLDCDVVVGVDAVYLEGVTNVDFRGGICKGGEAASTHCVCIGKDDSTGVTTTGKMEGVTVLANQGHGMILGAGAQDFTIYRNTLGGSAYSLILKECGAAGHPITVRENLCVGGSVATFYVKAGNYINATRNTIVNPTTGVAVKCAKGDTNNNYGNVTFTDNPLTIGPGASAYDIPTANDNGGCVFDRNSYNFQGLSNYGSVKGTASIATLAALRIAWDGYGDFSNEHASWDLPVSSFAAVASVALPAAPGTGSLGAKVVDIKTKTDALPASPAAVGSTMALTSAYDAAKTAASQASVNALPTAGDIADAVFEETSDEHDGLIPNYLNAPIESRLAAYAYTGAPTVSQIAAAVLSADVGDVEDTAAADSLATVVLACFHFGIDGNEWVVKKTDDETEKVRLPISTSASARPIIGVGGA